MNECSGNISFSLGVTVVRFCRIKYSQRTKQCVVSSPGNLVITACERILVVCFYAMHKNVASLIRLGCAALFHFYMTCCISCRKACASGSVLSSFLKRSLYWEYHPTMFDIVLSFEGSMFMQG